MEEYINYLLNRGKRFNREIKNNIYFSEERALELLLIDYVIDTFNNFDRRNCPCYQDNSEIIVTEDPILYNLITEDEDNYIADEEDIQLISENSIDSEDIYMITNEEGIKTLETEGDFNIYTFDRESIKTYLDKLIKDLTCQQK